MPANADNLDLDDTDEYDASDIKDAIKVQLSSRISNEFLEDHQLLNVNNRILIDAQNKVGNRWMNMVDEKEFSENSPKFGNELDINDGEEYLMDNHYKDTDINDYLKQM